MTYATQQNLIDRFGNDELLAIADRDNDDTIDATVVTQALEDADDEIDGYLAKRYALPLDSTNAAKLERIAADLARYRLYVNNPPDYVTDAATAARRWLRDVANGVVELGVDPPATAADDGAEVAGPDRVFNSTTLKGL